MGRFTAPCSLAGALLHRELAQGTPLLQPQNRDRGMLQVVSNRCAVAGPDALSCFPSFDILRIIYASPAAVDSASSDPGHQAPVAMLKNVMAYRLSTYYGSLPAPCPHAAPSRTSSRLFTQPSPSAERQVHYKWLRRACVPPARAQQQPMHCRAPCVTNRPGRARGRAARRARARDYVYWTD